MKQIKPFIHVLCLEMNRRFYTYEVTTVLVAFYLTRRKYTEFKDAYLLYLKSVR